MVKPLSIFSAKACALAESAVLPVSSTMSVAAEARMPVEELEPDLV